MMSTSSIASQPEGTLAPTIVIQNMTANSRTMIGNPHSRLVTMRSIVRSSVGRAACPGGRPRDRRCSRRLV